MRGLARISRYFKCVRGVVVVISMCTQCVVGRVQLLVLVVPPYIGRKCSRKAKEIHH